MWIGNRCNMREENTRLIISTTPFPYNSIFGGMNIDNKRLKEILEGYGIDDEDMNWVMSLIRANNQAGLVEQDILNLKLAVKLFKEV